jgi:hypothetical protein
MLNRGSSWEVEQGQLLFPETLRQVLKEQFTLNMPTKKKE